MMTIRLLLATCAAAALAPAVADAATFTMTYTTNVDSTSGPAVTTNATITATANGFVSGLWDVSAITGTRGTQAITGFDADYNTFYFPAKNVSGFSSPTYFDVQFAELVFTTALGSYDLYRTSSDTNFYHEFDGGVGRLINIGNFSITQAATPAGVPEPTTWAMMTLGFGAVGYTLRRRRAAVLTLV